MRTYSEQSALARCLLTASRWPALPEHSKQRVNPLKSHGSRIVVHVDDELELGRLHSMESAASVLAVKIVTMLVQSAADIETEMTAFARQPGGGIIAIPDSFTVQHRQVIITLAARNSLPNIWGSLLSPSTGGLMAYGVDPRAWCNGASRR
jgi:hypothetical protein